MNRYFWGGFFAGQMLLLAILVWPFKSLREEALKARDWYLNEYPRR